MTKLVISALITGMGLTLIAGVAQAQPATGVGSLADRLAKVVLADCDRAHGSGDCVLQEAKAGGDMLRRVRVRENTQDQVKTCLQAADAEASAEGHRLQWAVGCLAGSR